MAVESVGVGMPARIGLVQVFQNWMWFTFHSDGFEWF